jgi:hypothetical protein
MEFSGKSEKHVCNVFYLPQAKHILWNDLPKAIFSSAK